MVVVWVELFSAHPEKRGSSGAEQRQVQQRQAAMWAGVDQVCAGGLTPGVASETSFRQAKSENRKNRHALALSIRSLYFFL